jgi:hypothetical protein
MKFDNNSIDQNKIEGFFCWATYFIYDSAYWLIKCETDPQLMLLFRGIRNKEGGIIMKIAIAMRIMPVVAVLLLLPFLVGFTGYDRITEDAVLAYFDRLEQMFNKRDSDGIAVLIAPEARIELEQTGKNSSEHMSLSREEYRTALHAGLAQLQGYQYIMKSKRISIAADGQSADVALKVVESYADGTRRVTNESVCKYKLVLRRGKLVAISISARAVER